jgi:hypothetical protein
MTKGLNFFLATGDRNMIKITEDMKGRICWYFIDNL